MTYISLTKLIKVDKMIKLTQRLSIILLVAGLIACGGGGSSSSSPKPLAIGEVAVGRINHVSDANRWIISLKQKGALLVYTTSAGKAGVSDTAGRIFDANGKVIAENNDVGDSEHFRLCLVLEPNDYIVDVVAFQFGTYNIHAEFDETKTSGYCGIDTFNEWTIEDYGIRDLHRTGVTGEGVNISIVDGGLEIRHEDLRENVLPGMSYNYLTEGNNPVPANGRDAHGTTVAGVIAARSGNGIGVTGVAGRASIYGYNLLSSYTLARQGDAMFRNAAATDISSNSWGPDDNAAFHPVDDSWERGIKVGLNSGSNGKGISYIWAAGNGREEYDNSNYDEITNFYGVVAVCAVSRNRSVAFYSEAGANLWLCGPSDSRVLGVTTTDLTGTRGDNQGVHDKEYSNLNYTNSFEGTSASAPFVAGVVALMRQVNSALTWRDVKLILAESSDMPAIDGIITGAEVYANNRAGSKPNYKFHHDYGFGIVNSTRAVAIASQWQSVPVPFKNHPSNQLDINLPIPDAEGGSVTPTINVSGSDINFIEYVEITVFIDNAYTGDLDISLISPSGKISHLAHSRECPNVCGDLMGFRFGSALHLGESADGEWTLRITDQLPGNTGKLINWELHFYGH